MLHLTTSHIIKRRNKKVRYDFLFINRQKFSDYSCEYEYDGAVGAGSDHAAIIMNLCNECNLYSTHSNI